MVRGTMFKLLKRKEVEKVPEVRQLWISKLGKQYVSARGTEELLCEVKEHYFESIGKMGGDLQKAFKILYEGTLAENNRQKEINESRQRRLKNIAELAAFEKQLFKEI